MKKPTPKPTGYVIAGAASGSGKTTVSLGLMAWLQKQGYMVAPFKVGPDFIDPGHHTHITGRASRNLDGWILSREYNINTFYQQAATADISIVEGVMGLYDGYDGVSEAGSTAEMAKWLGLPVILVVNAQSMARSGAALVKGFVEFDPDVRFAGVVFNNLGGPGHLDYLREAVEHYISVPLLGGIGRDEALAMPERHLGLITSDEHGLSPEIIDRLAQIIETGLDTTRLTAGLIPGQPETPEVTNTPSSPAVRIGVARDAAFCFYYPDNLEMMTENGAELVYFSPVSDQALPKNIAGLYFGGGYPELFAEQLAANATIREQIKQACQNHVPIYGECGGFMYLCRDFIDAENRPLPMCGCFPMDTRLLPRLKSLGYREVSLQQNTILGPAETRARGHEFHYSEIVGGPVDTISQAYAVSTKKGTAQTPEGFCVHNTLGSYVHLHFGSNPDVCRHFVDACREYKKAAIPL